MKTLLIVGSTGLVGREVVRQALADRTIERVVALSRRPLELRDLRLENQVLDFDALPSDAPWWNVDAVICTLGTTMRQAGSRAGFHKVDHHYVLAVAQRARTHGTKVFALTSSLAAKVSSGNFYLRTKGETERDLAVQGFVSLTFVRPSLIGGERKEQRWTESFGLKIFTLLAPILPRRYRIAPAERIAAALLAAARAAQAGVRIVESEEI